MDKTEVFMLCACNYQQNVYGEEGIDQNVFVYKHCLF